MGATHKAIRVDFPYYIGEVTVAVSATVTPGRADHTYRRDDQTGQDEEPEAHIICATIHPQNGCKAEIWENIPAAILKDMERAALEECF